MNASASGRPSLFWVTWLIVAACVMIACGATLILAPEWVRAGFSLLLYGEAGWIDALGDEAVHYVALAHAVLGSVMMAWGMAVLLVTLGR